MNSKFLWIIESVKSSSETQWETIRGADKAQLNQSPRLGLKRICIAESQNTKKWKKWKNLYKSLQSWLKKNSFLQTSSGRNIAMTQQTRGLSFFCQSTFFSGIILAKLQLQNLGWTSTSKSWPNLEILCSKSEQKLNFMTKLHLPNLHQTIVNTFLIINMSNSDNNSKF